MQTSPATLDIKGKKIRIYNDIDCDRGRRRNKRDKSIYVIGYRLHTLTAIDAKAGHSFPIVSLLAPALSFVTCSIPMHHLGVEEQSHEYM